MLEPVSATYKLTVRNSGDEVVLSDDDVKEIVKDYIDGNYPGVLAEVEVERVDDGELS